MGGIPLDVRRRRNTSARARRASGAVAAAPPMKAASELILQEAGFQGRREFSCRASAAFLERANPSGLPRITTLVRPRDRQVVASNIWQNSLRDRTAKQLG